MLALSDLQGFYETKHIKGFEMSLCYSYMIPHKYPGKKEMLGMQTFGVRPNMKAVEYRTGCTKCFSLVRG